MGPPSAGPLHCGTPATAFPPPACDSGGFTAIELLTVIAILAILASLAAPRFTSLIERWRVRQVVESLQSTLYYARAEAIRRGGGVSIRKLPQDTPACPRAVPANAWDCGWAVYAGSEPILRVDTPAHITVTRTRAGPNAGTIQLDRWGNLGGLTAHGFTIAPHPQGIASPATRGLCMGAGGRIRVVGQEQVPCGA